MSVRKTESEFAPDLLGYRLGLIEPQERAKVEAAFDGPEALQVALDALDRTLAPLDADRVDPPPADLVQGVLERVAGADKTLAFPKSAQSIPETSDHGSRGGAKLAFRELIGLAAAILMFVGIFVPGYRTAREAAHKVACANNLRLIGSGQELYAEANAGTYPFAGNVASNSRWGRVDPQGRDSLPNSRHSYLLVRGRFVPVEVFNCQGHQGGMPFNGNDPEDYLVFPDPWNNSYATDFVLTPWHKRTLLGSKPLAADMTPLVNERGLIIRGAPSTDNSRSHEPLGGQNVLRANGSVLFFRSPRIGGADDDIYRIRGVDLYDGSERPSSRSDVFLVP